MCAKLSGFRRNLTGNIASPTRKKRKRSMLDDDMSGVDDNQPAPVPPNVQQQQLLQQQQQQQQPLPTDVVIAQILHQLQQQQAITNQLLQNNHLVQEQQRNFMQQQGNILRNIQVHVPPNPEAVLDSLAGNVKEFRYDSENNITFNAWFSRYKDLFDKDAARLDDPAKVRLLMRKLGTVEHERYLSFILPQAASFYSFEQTVEKLGKLFGTTESTISKRFRCLQLAKGATEDYVAYACRINKNCVEFELGKMSEEEFKCLMFVCGLKDEADGEIRTRLLTRIEEKTDVTLEQLSSECQRLLTLRHDTAMIEKPGSSVHAIRKQQQFQKPSQEPRQWAQRQAPREFRQRQQHPGGRKTPHGEGEKVPPGPCWNCGAMHYNRDCHFKSHQCSECSRYGHKEGYCRTAKKGKRKTKTNSVTVETKIVQVNSIKERRKFVPVTLNGVSVKLQFDTASDISVVSSETWKRLGKPPTRPPKVNAKSASGDPLKLESEFDCSITVNGVSEMGVVFVVNQDLHIMGLDLIEKFQLDAVPMNVFCRQVGETSSTSIVGRLKTAYPSVFSTTLGRCTKTQVKLELKPDQKPVFRPKRPVAYAMYSAVDEELDRLERLNIISPVDYSEWAAPIVVVRKANGTIRICGDYSTGLNAALQPNQYPLPLPQDIFMKLSSCKFFSIIDMSDSYLQVEVDDVSSLLLSINTHRGIYKVNRLAPGVKPAPGAFQQIVETMLAGLKQTCGYIDDIVVGGATEEEHWHNLNALFQRLEDFGFTVRLEKCSFGRKQIKYLGHLLDQHGTRPDPAKIESIKMMPAPTDVSGVRSFLGAINYYGKFVPNMRALRYPLDELLKAGAKFDWTPDCERAFNKFKEILSSDLLLTHYNPALEIIVSADASSIGLGATISHRFPDGSVKVVQHASRALAPAERNYSQIDREGLAIIFAITKFHRMVFGRHFRLQTDHAPLLRIFGSPKGIPVYTANRLQRWALMLLMYDFTIEYVATDKFGHADILSRLINRHVKPDEDYVIAAVTLEDDVRSAAFESFDVLPLSFKTVRDSTHTDPVLNKVYRYVQEGWPKALPASADRELKRFHNQSDSLTTLQGCILFCDRLVVPSHLRKRCLDQLHQGHPGIGRMKAVARSYVYWPSLDVEIADYVRTCPHCAAASKAPAHAPPIPWPKSARPWQRVHVDYAGPIDGEYFLLVIDSYTKWPEIVQTRRITSIATIAILRSLFARLGMPEKLVSDNGTQFTSAEFAQFCAENGIDHVTTAPFHPQSNGQAERFVDTFKRAVKKIREGRGKMDAALDTFLLTYRSTPNQSAPDGLSPSEVMFGRRVRTCLELLRPPPSKPPEPVQLPEVKTRSLNRGDAVFVKVYAKNTWSWLPGVVIEKVGRVMYNVLGDGDRLVRSHINQIKNRATSSPGQAPGTSQPAKQKQLPMDVLLDAWDLVTTANASPPPTASPNQTTLSEDFHGFDFPSLSPSLPEVRSSPDLSPASTSSSSSSTSTSSSSFESAVASTPTAQPPVQQPRRSSRVRKPPVRFNPYLRY